MSESRIDAATHALDELMASGLDGLAANATALRSQLAEREAEVERLRQGLLQCATEAGEDVSDGIPGWPDVVDWAVRAVKETRAEGEEETDRLSAEVKRLREVGDAAIKAALDGIRMAQARFPSFGKQDARDVNDAVEAWHTATGGTTDGT